MADRLFSNGNGDTVSQSYVEDAKQDRMGETMDGYAIYHTVYHDSRRHKHISYDTVVVRGEHQYIKGSGHETDDYTGNIARWDMGVQVTWREAQRKYMQDLVMYPPR